VDATYAVNLLSCLQPIFNRQGIQGWGHSSEARPATIVSSAMCGARSLEAVKQLLHTQLSADWTLLGYFKRPPTDSGFRYLLLKLNWEILEACLRG
jgi:hypothetical protein